jgi:hypothetical protein
VEAEKIWKEARLQLSMKRQSLLGAKLAFQKAVQKERDAFAAYTKLREREES